MRKNLLTAGLTQTEAPRREIAKHVDVTLRRLGISSELVRRAIHKVIEDGCRFHAHYVPNPLMPRGLVEKKFDKYRTVPHHDFGGVREITEHLAREVSEMLFEAGEHERLNAFTKLHDSPIAFSLPAFEAVLLHTEAGKEPSRRNLVEVFRMRLSAKVRPEMLEALDPFLRECDFEISGREFLVRSPRFFSSHAVDAAAERIRAGKLHAGGLERFRETLRFVGLESGVADHLWSVIHGLEQAEDALATLRAMLSYTDDDADDDVAEPDPVTRAPVSEPAADAEPVSALTASETAETSPSRDGLPIGMSQAYARVEASLGAGHADVPLATQRALIAAESALTGPDQHAFRLAERAGARLASPHARDLRAAHRMLDTLAMELFLQLRNFNYYFQPSASKDKSGRLVFDGSTYVRALSTLTLRARQLMGDAPDAVKHSAHQALVAVYLQKCVELEEVHPSRRDPGRPAVPQLTWDPGSLLAGADPEVAAFLQDLDTAFVQLDALLAVVGKDDDAEKALPFRPLDPDLPSSLVVRRRGQGETAVTEVTRYAPLEVQPIHFERRNGTGGPVRIAQPSVAGAPCFPGNSIPLSEMLPEQAAAYSYRCTGRAREALHEVSDALTRSALGPLKDSLQALGIMPRLLMIPDQSGVGREYFLLDVTQVEAIGAQADPVTEEVASYLREAGIPYEDGAYLLPVAPRPPAPRVEAPPTFAEQRATVTAFLDGRRFTLEKAKQFLEIAGITIQHGNPHGKAVDALGRFRPLGGREFREKEMPSFYVVNILFKDFHGFPPIGDASAIYRWIQAGGRWEDI